jgi:hypothetical protein
MPAVDSCKVQLSITSISRLAVREQDAGKNLLKDGKTFAPNGVRREKGPTNFYL